MKFIYTFTNKKINVCIDDQNDNKYKIIRLSAEELKKLGSDLTKIAKECEQIE
jgi:hypothetical protein